MKASEIKVGEVYAVVASSPEYDLRHKGTVLRKGKFMQRVRGTVWSRGHEEERNGFLVQVEFQHERGHWTSNIHEPSKGDEPGTYWLTGRNIVQPWESEVARQNANELAKQRKARLEAELEQLASGVNHAHGLSLRVSTYPSPHLSASDADMRTMAEILLTEGCGDA